MTNGQAVHSNGGTESDHKETFDSSTNVSQEQHASLDQSFLYSKNVILVQSYEDTCDKETSGDDDRNSVMHTPHYDSICSEDNDRYGHKSSTYLGNEGQDKITGDEIFHKEDFLDKDNEDFKASSSDEDDISIIDCPPCENPANIDKENKENIQDDNNHNKDLPFAVKQSFPNVGVSGIDDGEKPEDDISGNGYLQNHTKLASMYPIDDTFDFADDSDDIGSDDGSVDTGTAFRSGNGEAKCTDFGADKGDEAGVGHVDSRYGGFGGLGGNDNDDDRGNVRVLNDDDNDHNKEDNDDSDVDEPSYSGEDKSKNSDNDAANDDVNAKDDGGSQCYQQKGEKTLEKDSVALLVERQELNEGRC